MSPSWLASPTSPAHVVDVAVHTYACVGSVTHRRVRPKSRRAGKTVSIPDARYKALMGLAKLTPRTLVGTLSSRTGRRFGPR